MSTEVKFVAELGISDNSDIVKLKRDGRCIIMLVTSADQIQNVIPLGAMGNMALEITAKPFTGNSSTPPPVEVSE